MSFSSNLNHYGMAHVASVSDVLLDNSFTPPCQRMGGMVSFRTFEDFVRCVPSLGLAPAATHLPGPWQSWGKALPGLDSALGWS